MDRADRWKFIDNLKRRLFLKNELKRVVLRSTISNQHLNPALRYLAYYHYLKLHRFSSRVQQKSKCVRTGRVWSTVKLARYSRFVFRIESNSGNLPGFRRASW